MIRAIRGAESLRVFDFGTHASVLEQKPPATNHSTHYGNLIAQIENRFGLQFDDQVFDEELFGEGRPQDAPRDGERPHVRRWLQTPGARSSER